MSIRGKKIKLYCVLKNKHGALLGNYGSVLTVGRNVSIKLAKQLLASQSAILIGGRPAPLPPNPRVWPNPVMWGPYESKGKATAKTISVHIPIYLDGARGNRSWFKVQAAPSTFCQLHDRWFETVSERRLGMLAFKAMLAGSGNVSASQQAPSPSGIDLLEIKPGRVQDGRSVPVTIRIHQDEEHLSLKFLAEKDVFQRLAAFHTGDELSDSRFGYLLRAAVWEARDHVLRAQLYKRKDNGRPLQRMAWRTAAWLGPALLDRLRLAMESSSPTIEMIRSYAEKEHPDLRITSQKIAARNLAAFLVYKNWQNWRGRLRDGGVTISEWPTKISPIKRVGEGSDEGEGKYESHEFWDEIFNRQLKLKFFPWKTLERTDSDRFKELTVPAIETAKARYAQDNPGFSWKQCQEEQPDQYERLIDRFLRKHMALYQFALDSRVSQQAARRMNWPVDTDPAIKKDPQTGDWFVTIPTTGPTFLLPKSLDETVRDILLNREVFILSGDSLRRRSRE